MKTKKRNLSALDYCAIAVATSGGAGFAPKAPGTAGALAGLLLYLAIESLGLGAYYLHAIIFFLVIGTWASWRVEILYGHDSQRIVVDEVAGQMITFALVAGREQLSAGFIILGFVLFRLFDILKPFPLRRLERLKYGAGVMADDVGAGLYAMLILAVARNLFRR